jgi:putative membrane protein
MLFGTLAKNGSLADVENRQAGDFNMIRTLLTAGAMSLAAIAAPTLAQTASTTAAADIGVSPMGPIDAATYVKMAADSDMYEIKSSQLALRKAQRDDVKAFARQMIADHTQTTKALTAALNNSDRRIAKPPMKMSAENEANLKLLQKAPKGGFDTMYLTQQAAAHQKAWSLHQGYATNGTDAPLKQVAATAVPIIEQHFGHVKGMVPAAMSSN